MKIGSRLEQAERELATRLAQSSGTNEGELLALLQRYERLQRRIRRTAQPGADAAAKPVRATLSPDLHRDVG